MTCAWLSARHFTNGNLTRLPNASPLHTPPPHVLAQGHYRTEGTWLAWQDTIAVPSLGMLYVATMQMIGYHEHRQ